MTRIDPQTLATKTIPVGNDPAAVAVDAAGAWVANAGDNAVVRLDTDTNAVAATMPVGDGPAAILLTATVLWVANLRDGTVMRLDRRSGDVEKTIRLGGAPSALATADGHVWVALAPAPPELPLEDGARLTTRSDFASLDPASGIWHNYQLCANLVRYPDKPGPAGSRIVPEVAEAIPVPTAGGTTYTFKIRPGFRFSPPSNEVVTARTFKSTIERVVDPRMNSWFASSFSGIVGYGAYVAGKSRGISGIVARGDTLTIRLSRPDGALLANLADNAACAVPLGTPAVGGLNAIPSAGPYYIASYTPRQQLVLERNPNYHGNRLRRLERFVVAIGVDPARALEQVEDGTADYATQLPRHVGPRLESAYGSGSEAARAGHQQYFVSDALGLRVLHMNASRPLFSDVRLRRAVNYAIDRQALAAEGRRAAEVNPFNAGKPTDDYVPPSASGAADFRVYPLKGPDLRRAKRIAGHPRATAVMYTPNVSPWREEAQIVRRNLRPLGIDVQITEFAIGDFYTRVTRPGEPFDLAVSGWSFASDPVEMLGMYRSGTGSTNISHFENSTFDRKLAAAARLSGARRYRAVRRLAHELQRRTRARRPVRGYREPRFLLGADRVPDLPADLGHRPRRALLASVTGRPRISKPTSTHEALQGRRFLRLGERARRAPCARNARRTSKTSPSAWGRWLVAGERLSSEPWRQTRSFTGNSSPETSATSATSTAPSASSASTCRRDRASRSATATSTPRPGPPRATASTPLPRNGRSASATSQPEEAGSSRSRMDDSSGSES